MTTPFTVGRYSVFAEIASGGMASVHLGRLLGPVGFSRTVAIKRLHPQFAKDAEFVAMFLDEARLAGRVRHPNVVPVLDVVAMDGELFLVMEYVAGESLARLRRAMKSSAQRPPPAIAVAIMSGTLHGLHAAHEATNEHGKALDIVHRDVSPQNVLVGSDGIPRVVDFGVAKAIGRATTTRDGQLKGKMPYMAPEQLLNGKVDRRVDVYGASVVLWELLTGEPLFRSESEGGLFDRVLNMHVAPPSEHAAEVPPALDAIVLRGLDRDRARRFATAEEMALALERAVRPATHSEVGRWVRSLIDEVLTERAQRIVEIESNRTAPDELGLAAQATREDPTHVDATSPNASQISSVSVSSPRRAPSTRRFAAGAVVVVAAVVVAVSSIVIAARKAEHDAGPPVAGTPASSSASSGVESAKPTATASASDTTEKQAAASLTATSKPHTPSPLKTQSKMPAKTPRPTPSTKSTATTTKPSCFEIDSQGIKHIKPECL